MAGRYPGAGAEADSLDRFYELTMVRPWGRESGRWLKDLEQQFGVESVVEALESEYEAKREAKTLISRTDARLSRAADKRRDAQVAEAKTKPKVDPEMEARQRAVMAEMIGHQEVSG